MQSHLESRQSTKPRNEQQNIELSRKTCLFSIITMIKRFSKEFPKSNPYPYQYERKFSRAKRIQTRKMQIYVFGGKV